MSFLLLLLHFNFFSAYANLNLDVVIVHNKGMDKGLILSNEVHTVEDVSSKDEVEIAISRQWFVVVKANFLEKKDNHLGPSAKLLITSDFYKKGSSQFQLIHHKTFTVDLGEKIEYRYDHSTDQLIQLKVKTRIR